MNSAKKSKRIRRSSSKSPDRPSLLVNTPQGKVALSTNKQPVEGCLVCGKDNDHSCLLICERCNAEYHTYCLNPPLQGVPEGDWFCDKCKHLKSHPSMTNHKDSLDELVAALPPSFTSRFGEIIWAAGGVGFGWWPACIYDPRLTIGSARKLASKHLGKKHLVYFFGCYDAPFTVLLESKCYNWERGLMEDYEAGKTAKSMGKNRALMFEVAFRHAVAENDKPVEMRLDWNHEEIHGAPAEMKKVSVSNGGGVTANGGNAGKKTASSPHGNAKKRKKSKPEFQNVSIRRSVRGSNEKARTEEETIQEVLEISKKEAIANKIESTESQRFFCKLKILDSDPYGDLKEIRHGRRIGFICMPCRKTSTFADARRIMGEDLDAQDGTPPPGTQWKFYVPGLGKVSFKQETKLGSMFEILLAVKDDGTGDGSVSNPLPITVFSESLNP